MICLLIFKEILLKLEANSFFFKLCTRYFPSNFRKLTALKDQRSINILHKTQAKYPQYLFQAQN